MLTLNSPALLRDIVKIKARHQTLLKDIQTNIDTWSMDKIESANVYRQELQEQIRKLELVLHNKTFE